MLLSHLKWRFGVDFLSIWLLLGFAVNAYYFTGLLKLVFYVLIIINIIYIVIHFLKWKKTMWRKVHFRGMLHFNSIAEKEVAAAKAEGRNFDLRGTCNQLAIDISGGGDESTVNNMVEKLNNEQGNYCVNLLKRNYNKAFPNIKDIKDISEILEASKKISFGPQLVMCSIIENKFGEEEATKYILALLSGKAN